MTVVMMVKLLCHMMVKLEKMIDLTDECLLLESFDGDSDDSCGKTNPKKFNPRSHSTNLRWIS